MENVNYAGPSTEAPQNLSARLTNVLGGLYQLEERLAKLNIRLEGQRPSPVPINGPMPPDNGQPPLALIARRLGEAVARCQSEIDHLERSV